MYQRKIKTISLAALCVLLSFFSVILCACGRNQYTEYTFFGMDTYITLRLSGEKVGKSRMTEITSECERITAELERVISAHMGESDSVYGAEYSSELFLLNQSEDASFKVSGTLKNALSRGYELSVMTDGAYDLTLGALSELWNINNGGSRPSEADIKTALDLCGYRRITIDGENVERPAGLLIDLGGIGKGIAAEKLIEYLGTTELTGGLVSVGGNIGVFGEKTDGEPYKIGIRKPEDPNDVIGYIYINEGFVSVSGDYERFFTEDGVRYHHIMDSHTGYPSESGIHQAAVYSTDGALADALSTALFVMGADKAAEFYAENADSFEAVILTDEGITVTEDLNFEEIEKS